MYLFSSVLLSYCLNFLSTVSAHALDICCVDFTVSRRDIINVIYVRVHLPFVHFCVRKLDVACDH